MIKSVIVLAVLFLFPLVAAEIIIDDTFDTTYNYGDIVHVNFSLEKKLSLSDYLETTVECEHDDVLVSKQYVLSTANEKKTFSFDFPVTILGEDCSFVVTYDSEEVMSEEFEVSDTIRIALSMNAESFFPGETVTLFGNATKFNGDLLEGSMHVTLPGILDQTFPVEGGIFSADFIVEDSFSPGVHSLTVEAVERDFEEEIINEGKVIKDITILSEPRTVRNDLPDSFDPPGNLSFSFHLEDQVGNTFEEGEILLKIIDPLGAIVLEKDFLSSDYYSYEFSSDALRGAWKFNFYHGSVFLSKQVYFGENPEISTFVVSGPGQSYLRITNEGNVLYQGIVSYVFSNESGAFSIPVNVDLGVGETLDYPLDVDGSYNLSFDGESLGAFSFTGASIGLDFNLDTSSYWKVLLILIFVGMGYFVFSKKNTLVPTLKKAFTRTRKEKPVKLAKRKTFSAESHGMYTGITSSSEALFSGKLAYIAFFSFDESFVRDARALCARKKWSLRQVGKETFFVLFYADSAAQEHMRLFDFVREMREAGQRKGVKVSVAIHLEQFENKISFLKKFSSVGRKMLDFSRGRIIVSKAFFDILGLGFKRHVEHLDFGKEIIEAYIL